MWLPLAQQGDAAAQTYVGEIFEKGLGVPPDYAAAAHWYRRAAEAGHSRAAINLGNLLEQGLGGPKDPTQALNWYRRAAGLSALDFEIVPGKTAAELQELRAQIAELRSQLQAKQAELDRAQGELEKLRRSLEQKSSEADSERTALARSRRELEDLRGKEQTAAARLAEIQRSIGDGEATLAARDREIAALRASLAGAEASSAAQRTALDREAAALRESLARSRRELEEQRGRDQTTVARLTELQRSTSESEARLEAKDREVAALCASLLKAEADSAAQRTEVVALRGRLARTEGDSSAPRGPGQLGKAGGPRPALPFGAYHALVIGNNNYRELSRLRTAVNDAQAVATILREQYRFNVTLLTDGTHYQILTALNALREKLTIKDNLLIYYAGHGYLDAKNQRGHWLPIDAELTSSANWIPNTHITDTLNIMQVKQLLLVADSCYAGTLTRSATGQLKPGLTEEQRSDAIQQMAQRRSRMAMTSGGVEPVLDSAGGAHSAFAEIFLQVLRENDGALLGQEMFNELRLRVFKMAERLSVPQVPEYAPIQHGGHEGGDFVFVRPES